MKIPSRFAGRCSACRIRFEAGTMIEWRPGSRKGSARCLKCAGTPPPTPPEKAPTGVPDPTETRLHFESITEATALALSPCAVPDGHRASLTGDHGFAGRDLADACKAALIGCTKEAGEWERAVAEDLRGTSGQITCQTAPIGPVLNLPAYIAGDDRNSFFQFQPDPNAGHVLTLFVNTTVSAATSQATIAERGRAVLALIDTIEARGMRVEVIAFFCVGESYADPKPGGTVTVRLKSAQDPLDVPVLAYWLADRSALRRIMFALCEHQPRAVRARYHWGTDVGFGYGSIPRAGNERAGLDARPEDFVGPEGIIRGEPSQAYADRILRDALEKVS